jgi:uncharacterized protein (DUF58 family)
MRRAFVGYLLGFVVVALVGRSGVLLTATYVVAGAYLLSVMWVRRAVPQMEVERRFADRAFPGDRVDVELLVHNKGRLPVAWVELHERLPTAVAMPPSHREVVSLAPGERARVTYTVEPSRRGYYSLGPLSARTGDILGVADEELPSRAADGLIVYPEVVPLARLGLPARGPLAAVRTTSPLFFDPARPAGVRDYEPGDPERRIHWTATAREGRLLTKQLEPTVARETIVCLDLDRRSYPVGRRITSVELAITVAASVAHHVVTVQDQPAGLVTEAHDPVAGADARIVTPMGSQRRHLAAVLEVLARVQPTRAAPLARVLHETSRELPWGATLVVVSGSASPQLLAGLYRLRRTAFLVARLLVGEDDPAAARRAESLGITTYRITDPRQLEVVR